MPVPSQARQIYRRVSAARSCRTRALCGLRLFFIIDQTFLFKCWYLVAAMRKVEARRQARAIMRVTYPSTWRLRGTRSPSCAILVQAGGQVYVDGAVNMNALVEMASGTFGDASHLNLLKTFAIPARRRHPRRRPDRGALAPRAVPAEPPARPQAGPGDGGRPERRRALRLGRRHADLVGEAHGCAGAQGTRRGGAGRQLHGGCASTTVLYSGEDGGGRPRVHPRPARPARARRCAVDVAKRLIDYGFRADDVLPRGGTLMVEPTEETRTRPNSDRFCDAMIAIRGEIRASVEGVGWRTCCAARRTAQSLVGDWDQAYDHERRLPRHRVGPQAKYWPIVRRIDGAFGDRNLVCTCPPPEAT